MNYQLALDHLLAQLPAEPPELVLHSCCAVCSSYVLEYLARYFRLTVFYSNSNIWPRSEYEHRKSEQIRLIETAKYPNPVRYAEDEYDHLAYLDAVRGLESEPEGGARCAKCFELRLERTAAFAERAGIARIATTLTVSPHKNAAVINEVGQNVAARRGLLWLPSDFKKRSGYLRATRLADEFALYRQNYCGCEFAHTLIEPPKNT